MYKEKPTLVILPRICYGGLKQVDAFTPERDTIIDFSMFDALQAGFGKFVFIIRRSFENFLILSVFQKVKFRPRFFNFHSK